MLKSLKRIRHPEIHIKVLRLPIPLATYILYRNHFTTEILSPARNTSCISECILLIVDRNQNEIWRSRRARAFMKWLLKNSRKGDTFPGVAGSLGSGWLCRATTLLQSEFVQHGRTGLLQYGAVSHAQRCYTSCLADFFMVKPMPSKSSKMAKPYHMV